MKINKILIITALVCGVGLSCSKVQRPSVEPETKPEAVDKGFKEGELLVKFSPEMTDILDSMSGPATKSGIPSTDEVLSILGAYSLSRVFPIDPRNEERTREAGLHLWYIVKVPEDTDIVEACERLSCLGEVSQAKCNRY
ncbi:MAG: protease, partial [Bacteroidales bacterium]|nr:protease [Bacteroidales bacterium]